MICEHEDGLEGELPLAVVEEVLKAGPEEVNDHDVVVAFDSEPVDIWDAD